MYMSSIRFGQICAFCDMRTNTVSRILRHVASISPYVARYFASRRPVRVGTFDLSCRCLTNFDPYEQPKTKIISTQAVKNRVQRRVLMFLRENILTTVFNPGPLKRIALVATAAPAVP